MLDALGVSRRAPETATKVDVVTYDDEPAIPARARALKTLQQDRRERKEASPPPFSPLPSLGGSTHFPPMRSPGEQAPPPHARTQVESQMVQDGVTMSLDPASLPALPLDEGTSRVVRSGSSVVVPPTQLRVPVVKMQA